VEEPLKQTLYLPSVMQSDVKQYHL